MEVDCQDGFNLTCIKSFISLKKNVCSFFGFVYFVFCSKSTASKTKTDQFNLYKYKCTLDLK